MPKTCFQGMCNTSLDAKKRFSIPAKFREEYKDAKEDYMLLVQDNASPRIDFFCEEKDLEAEINDRKAQMGRYVPSVVLDIMFNGCRDTLPLDAGGRTCALNSRYLADSGISGDMVVIGNGRYFSVYDETVYENMKSAVASFATNRFNAYAEASAAEGRRMIREAEGPVTTDEQ